MATNPPKSPQDEQPSDEVTQNAGMKTAAINADPTISLEEARNAAAGEGTNASGGTAPSSAQDHIPSNSDPNPSDLPSTGRPLPDEATSESSQ